MNPAKLVYLASRQAPRRLLGPRVEDRYEAELREWIGDVYVTVGKVTVGKVARTSRDLATKAAKKLAGHRGWIISEKRLGWFTRDASFEREIEEGGEDYVEVSPETLAIATVKTRRLSEQQVKDLREVVQASLSRAQDLLMRARHPDNKPKDEKEVEFYESIISRDEALLDALPTRCAVELDDPSDEELETEENVP